MHNLVGRFIAASNSLDIVNFNVLLFVAISFLTSLYCPRRASLRVPQGGTLPADFQTGMCSTELLDIPEIR